MGVSLPGLTPPATDLSESGADRFTCERIPVVSTRNYCLGPWIESQPAERTIISRQTRTEMLE